MTIPAGSGHSTGLHALFYVGLALLFTHELDAVARQEWRILAPFNGLDDAEAQIVFVLVHIPAFAALLWLSGHRSERLRTVSQIAVDLFLVLHAGLHFALSGSPDYAFVPPVETITVYGGAAVGLGHLGLLLRSPGRPSDPGQDD